MTGAADAEQLRGSASLGGSDSGQATVYPFGRERESGDIDAFLSSSDGPHTVVVVGERGAGRSTFTRDLVRRQRAAGTAALSVDCLPGDSDRPLLLALRLVRAMEQRIPDAIRQRRPASPVAGMLAAIEHGDQAAAADALTAALAQSAVTVLVVEDAQYADHQSLGMLDALDLDLAAPRVRFVISVLEPAATMGHCSAATEQMEQVEQHQAMHVVPLVPLTRQEVAALLTRRLRAVPDDPLAGLVHRLTRGVPAAIDALLTEWVRQDAIRTVGGHALLIAAAAVPVLPASDRYIVALHELGEPAVTVASALSVLWPLGRAAPRLAAAVTGLPADAVRAALSDLAGAGVVEELPAEGDDESRGWTFRLPLVEHAVREKLGPLDRGNLAKAAVEVLWAAEAEQGRPGAVILEEADAETYLPDRIAEAGALVDRARAAAELTAAAERMATDSGRHKALRWLQVAAYLVEEPGTHNRLMLRYATSAATACDYPAVREAVEALLRGVVGTGDISDEMLQEAVGLLVGAASADGDLVGLSQMAEARWWNRLGPPAAVRVSGRALALCALGRWREALALLAGTEPRSAGAGLATVLPALRRSVAEMTLGRPEMFRRSLAMEEFSALTPGGRYAVSVVQADQLLGLADLRGAADLLAGRRTTIDELPMYTRFLWCHLQGRWDDAMALARRLFANNRRVGTPALGHHLFPERVTVILFARGRLRSAARLAGTMREDLGAAAEHEHIVCRAEAEVARTLGDLAEAERILRRGLEAAEAAGHVYATDELWAELAAVHTDAGDLPSARDSLHHLDGLVAQTDGERTRLLWLLGSARLLGADSSQADAARKHLLEAVALARHRGQPFETGVTLLAAARQEEDPAAMLFEAYELFDRVGAPLWRFRTRTDMRRAGLSVPGRGQATTENEQLLATMVSDGLTNRQVAGVLGLSQDAVANRLTRLFARTGARSRTELVSAVTRGSGSVADW